MAARRFSPTGYWAVYDDSDTTFGLPVIDFEEDPYGKRRAMICTHDGTVQRADANNPMGTFAFVSADDPEE